MVRRGRHLIGGAVIAAAVLLLGACGVTNTQQARSGTDDGGPFYTADDEITLYVPFAAGDTSDRFSRLFAEHFTAELEGNPSIVIQNVPGGAQKEGMNAYERSEHNGLNMAMSSGGLISSSHFDPEGIQFDLAGYQPVVAFGGGMILYGPGDTGPLDQLATSDRPVFYGGMELNASEAVRVFALEQLGLPRFEPLMGYDGGGAITTAVMRGELTLGNSTSSHYAQNVVPLAEQGEITPHMVQGYVRDGEVVRDPAFPDLPTMPEAYAMLTGQEPSGTGWEAYTAITATQTNLLRTYWMHGDAPEAARTAAADAAAAVAADPAFLEEAATLLAADPEPLVGAELEASVGQIQDLSPETVQWVEDYLDSRR
ncbi:tripartite-type tricarboxylate transporter receptor subunit TctC [Pseudonocardia autotrophica]|uniref:Tripartite tricarboxylate transporter family receptor n=1 Tax=Pseudonocardia autotrophica TaxID=2074 RepID=A0A1Y2MN94_PSEAH|nr:hypothetical protein [Pseudonocardia autotrophica]OSY36137.1 hypothetical protein BG845_05652 [Pseudonocardia autotrophica]TDN77619.1 tripartite-type tricarboxylate transporter receptor subunit TctC [Pseudonocardia autotrophica]BBG01649.1 hypothetical protein Pdca_28580 [Pseudonocardia autotrophica]